MAVRGQKKTSLQFKYLLSTGHVSNNRLDQIKVGRLLLGQHHPLANLTNAVRLHIIIVTLQPKANFKSVANLINAIRLYIKTLRLQPYANIKSVANLINAIQLDIKTLRL